MTVSLAGPATGGTLTGHDALYADYADMAYDGTLIEEDAADIGLPRIALATGVTQRVKWVWPIPVRWDAMAIRFSVIPEIASANNNVVVQFAYRGVTLASGSVRSAVTTISIATLSLGATQYNWNYFLPSEVGNVPITPGILGDAPFMQCSLSRLGGHGSNTLAGDCSIGLVTATRVPNT